MAKLVIRCVVLFFLFSLVYADNISGDTVFVSYETNRVYRIEEKKSDTKNSLKDWHAIYDKFFVTRDVQGGFFSYCPDTIGDRYVCFGVILPFAGDSAYIFKVPGVPDEDYVDHELRDCIYSHIRANIERMRLLCSKSVVIPRKEKEDALALGNRGEAVFWGNHREGREFQNIEMIITDGSILKYYNIPALDDAVSSDNYKIFAEYKKTYQVIKKYMNLISEGCRWTELVRDSTLFLQNSKSPRNIHDIGGRCPKI